MDLYSIESYRPIHTKWRLKLIVLHKRMTLLWPNWKLCFLLRSKTQQNRRLTTWQNRSLYVVVWWNPSSQQGRRLCALQKPERVPRDQQKKLRSQNYRWREASEGCKHQRMHLVTLWDNSHKDNSDKELPMKARSANDQIIIHLLM